MATTYIKTTNMTANEQAFLSKLISDDGYNVQDLFNYKKVDGFVGNYLEEFYAAKFKHNFEHMCRFEERILFLEDRGDNEFYGYCVEDGDTESLQLSEIDDLIEEVEHEISKFEACEKFRAQLDQVLVI